MFKKMTGQTLHSHRVDWTRVKRYRVYCAALLSVCLSIYMVIICISKFVSPKTIVFKCMTFNLRNKMLDTDDADTSKHWTARRAQVHKVIRSTDCDVIGTQEGVLTQIEEMADDLRGDYGHYGVGRSPDSSFGSSADRMNEHCSIFWKRDKFAVSDAGTFWLSEPGETPLPRIATWMLMELRESAKYELLFVSTHLTHVDSPKRARGKQMHSVTEFVRSMLAQKRAKELLVLVVGDFNEASRRNLWKKLFLEKGELYAGDILTDCVNKVGRKLNAGFTYHAFEGLEHAKNDKNHAPIDWLLCSHNFVQNDDIRLKSVRVVTDSESTSEGVIYPSDHFPVVLEVELTPSMAVAQKQMI